MIKRTSGMKNPINNLRRILPIAVAVLLLAMVLVAPVAAVNETKIGSTEYATLADALTAANDGDTIILLKDVTWKLPKEDNLLKQPMANVDVTIDGKYKILTVEGRGTANPLYVASGKTLTLMNMSVVDMSVGDVESEWDHGYLEFYGDVSFTNVQFKNGILTQGNSATFQNCSFVGKTENMAMYGAWVQNGTATFTDCTFTGTRGLKMHEEYDDLINGGKNDVGTVSVDRCTFTVTDKPGIAIGDVSGNTVKIKNCIFDGVCGGELGQYSYESDTATTEFTLTRSGNTFNNIDLTEGQNLDEGTYDVDVKEKVASGKKSHNNNDGTWTVMDMTTHTITWNNYNNVLLKSETVDYGTIPNYTGDTPAREEDNTNTYIFEGWNPAPSPVTDDETYTAVFTPVAKPVKNSPSSSGSSIWLTETPTPTPTQTPTETATPTDSVPTDIPVTQPTEEPPSLCCYCWIFVILVCLAVLAGIGAVAVLRRK